MSDDSVRLGDIGSAMLRLWWLPVLLGLAGLAAGFVAPAQVPTIYRAEATVLVGPTEGAVTRSATIRTSENLASFYADMARRQIILEPVTERVGLGLSWVELRNQVKAVVPSENLRLITVTVRGDTQAEADEIANALVEELVSLSPALPGGNSQEFINEQVDDLRETINDTQADIERLNAEAAAAVTPETAQPLRQEALAQQERLVALQRVYVELIAAEPTSDAGGLTVIDEASAVTDLARPDPTRQALVGGAVGAALGMLIAWVRSRRGGGGGAGAAAGDGGAPHSAAADHLAAIPPRALVDVDDAGKQRTRSSA